MKITKVKSIIALAIALVIFFTSLNMITSYLNIKKTVEEAVANQMIQPAYAIAGSMDVEEYKQFLANPIKNQLYWKIRKELNDARETIGAMYVYTMVVDNPRTSIATIVGLPEDAIGNYEIGIPCSVPEKQVKQAYSGKPFVTDVIDDPVYGSYLTVGVPIKDKKGAVIGFLGVDISAKVLENIRTQIVKNSIPNFIYNGSFVIILLASFFMLQKWYQRELKKEIVETEDTYQAEFRSLITSVKSLRHDFTNHIQVLHGLLKLGNHEQALDYLTTLSKEVRSIEPVQLNIDNPGLSVLLQMKKLTAQNHNVTISFDLSDDPFNQIKTTDLIKILSNLIDNAIEATTELPEDQRYMTIACCSKVNQYTFTITNTGPRIEEKTFAHLFTSGYSTKKAIDGKVRGQGLFIVSELVRSYRGKIMMESTEKETIATVTIPINHDKP